jgi:hypothetical protein
MREEIQAGYFKLPDCTGRMPILQIRGINKHKTWKPGFSPLNDSMFNYTSFNSRLL